MARVGGALMVAMVNNETSSLAQDVDLVLPIAVGPKRSFAATKNFLGALAAGLRLLASMTSDRSPEAGLADLPRRLARALENADPDLEPILAARSGLVLGRGASLGLAQEAALKMKELLGLPAEAFPSAKVAHGPWALTGPDCSVISWATDRVAAEVHRRVLDAARSEGCPVLDQPASSGAELHDLLRPLVVLPTFYRAMLRAAMARGLDPDLPSKLRKITETV